MTKRMHKKIGHYVCKDAKQKGREKCKVFGCKRLERIKGFCGSCYNLNRMREINERGTNSSRM